jgi:predicted secreted Zn-dependent protease
LRWQLALRQQGDTCEIDAVAVQVTVVVTLPRWEEPRGADHRLVKKWRKYLTALERHEAGHERNAADAAAAIKRRAGSLGRFPTCAAARAAVSEAAAKIVARAEEVDLAYDRKTRHGARQGARFP